MRLCAWCLLLCKERMCEQVVRNVICEEEEEEDQYMKQPQLLCGDEIVDKI